MSTDKLSTNELSTNQKRDLVARASGESIEALDSKIYRQIAIATNESAYEHDPDTLRDQVYGYLLAKVGERAGFDVETDPVTNSVLERKSSESTGDETDDGSEWASPMAASRSTAASPGGASINSDDGSDWPTATASTRSEELGLDEEDR